MKDLFSIKESDEVSESAFSRGKPSIHSSPMNASPINLSKSKGVSVKSSLKEMRKSLSQLNEIKEEEQAKMTEQDASQSMPSKEP